MLFVRSGGLPKGAWFMRCGSTHGLPLLVQTLFLIQTCNSCWWLGVVVGPCGFLLMIVAPIHGLSLLCGAIVNQTCNKCWWLGVVVGTWG